MTTPAYDHTDAARSPLLEPEPPMVYIGSARVRDLDELVALLESPGRPLHLSNRELTGT